MSRSKKSESAIVPRERRFVRWFVLALLFLIAVPSQSRADSSLKPSETFKNTAPKPPPYPTGYRGVLEGGLSVGPMFFPQDLNTAFRSPLTGGTGFIAEGDVFAGVSGHILLGIVAVGDLSPLKAGSVSLGSVQSNFLIPTLRIRPHNFGPWSPFIDLGAGVGFDSIFFDGQYSHEKFGFDQLPVLVFRGGLGMDYYFGHQLSLSTEVGWIQDSRNATLTAGPPLTASSLETISTPFNASVFFALVGFHFLLY